MDLIFTDPPYNVPIDGHVCGLGKIQHREFAIASGEMSPEAFTQFLKDALEPAARRCRDGAIALVCTDWRHMRELLDAGEAVFTELKNLCVWNKTNGGMGAFYRSKRELVFVFKAGKAAHTNTFGLGDSGRYRTNVWDYPGVKNVGADKSDSSNFTRPSSRQPWWRCDPRLFEARSDHPRQLRRLGNNADRGRDLRPQRPPHRV